MDRLRTGGWEERRALGLGFRVYVLGSLLVGWYKGEEVGRGFSSRAEIISSVRRGRFTVCLVKNGSCSKIDPKHTVPNWIHMC